VSDPDPGAPELVVGAWRGYRIWRMAGDRLTGWWYTGYVWAPGGSEASCYAKRWTRRGRRARHPGLPAPQRGCRCGLYALQEPWDFAGYLPFSVYGATDESKVVIGVVAGWGRPFAGSMGGARSSPGRWHSTGPRTLMASTWSGSLIGTAARSWRAEATCSPWLTSEPEPPAIPEPRQPLDAAARGLPRSAVHIRFGP
jgi:hypothetical protein